MAALATGPVLLDGFQLLIEQMVMSEPQFEFFVVLGIALLLWRPRPDLVTAPAAGASFAAAALTRELGQSLVLAGLLFCVLAAGRRFVPRVVTSAALLVAFVLPMIGYAAYNDAVNGTFSVPSQAASIRLYARVAASVTCTRLSLPSYERPLCPPPGVVKPHLGSLIQAYAQGAASPLVTYRPPNGETTGQVLNDFVKRAVLQQPLAVARSVGGSLARPFLSWRRDRKGRVSCRPSAGSSRPCSRCISPPAACRCSTTGRATRRRSTARWPGCCADTSCTSGTPQARFCSLA